MSEATQIKLVTIGGRALFLSALLAIIVMSLSDYTAERANLEKVRRATYQAQCEQIQNAYQCATYGDAHALSK